MKCKQPVLRRAYQPNPHKHRPFNITEPCENTNFTQKGNYRICKACNARTLSPRGVKWYIKKLKKNKELSGKVATAGRKTGFSLLKSLALRNRWLMGLPFIKLLLQLFQRLSPRSKLKSNSSN